MTLNSTGLGVGGLPSGGALMTVGATSNVSATANAVSILSNKAAFLITSDGATNAAGTTINYSWVNGGQGPLIFRNNAIANVMTLDSSGNVGIGVTPSAKLDVYQATLGTAYFRGGYSARQLTLTATSDGVNDGAVHTFLIGSSAGQYKFSNSSGTLMSLDASGNLILQSSATPATLTTNGQLTVNATSNTNLRFSYRGSDGVTRVANITLA
jgi:hypothetical protein